MTLLNSWGDYSEANDTVTRLSTRYERDQYRHRREVIRGRVCQAIILACGLVVAAVVAVGS